MSAAADGAPLDLDPNEYQVTRAEIMAVYGLTYHGFRQWRARGLRPYRVGPRNLHLYRLADVWQFVLTTGAGEFRTRELLGGATFACRRLAFEDEEEPNLADAIAKIESGEYPAWVTPADYAKITAGMQNEARRRAALFELEQRQAGAMDPAELERMGVVVKGVLEQHLAEGFWATLAAAGADYDQVREVALDAMDDVVRAMNEHIARLEAGRHG